MCRYCRGVLSPFFMFMRVGRKEFVPCVFLSVSNPDCGSSSPHPPRLPQVWLAPPPLHFTPFRLTPPRRPPDIENHPHHMVVPPPHHPQHNRNPPLPLPSGFRVQYPPHVSPLPKSFQFRWAFPFFHRSRSGPEDVLFLSPFSHSFFLTVPSTFFITVPITLGAPSPGYVVAYSNLFASFMFGPPQLIRIFGF